MRLVALTVYYLAGQGVQALSISEPVIDPRSMTNDCNDLYQCRTVWNIIWSCVATIFACTWVALHLNVPEPHEKWRRIALRKVRIMMVAVIAPEIVVAWAMRQWLVARRVAKKYEKHGWTKAHGFFAIMGGFMRFDGDEGPYILSPEDLGSHLQKGEIDIMECDIKDKSKGDMLSKGFAILQTGWFILQCIARRFEGLSITELEIATLAFAILNFATYWLWWNKPLDVHAPFLVRKRLTSEQGDEEADEDKEVEDEGGWDMFKHVVTPGWDAIRNAIVPRTTWNAFKIIRNVPSTVGRALRRTIDRRCHSDWTAVDVLRNVAIVLLFPVFILFKMGTAFDGEDIQLRSKRVPTFYSGKLKSGERDCAVAVVGLFATIFGGIHCIAWSFQFPTHREQLLWRLSSLTITCVPVLFITLSRLNSAVHDMRAGWVRELLNVVWDIMTIALPFLYILARVLLLVLAFMSFRLLPPSAYYTARWTTFIPHV